MGEQFKFCDMVCERLLASFRQSVGGDMKSIDMETLVGHGILTQALKEHLRCRRDFPKVTTLKQWLEGGLDCRATKTRDKFQTMCGTL